MDTKKEKYFENIQDEIAYYRVKYKKYKDKYSVYLELQNRLRQDYSNLMTESQKLKDQLKCEKILRKKFEDKVIHFMKFDQVRDLEKFSKGERNIRVEEDNRIEIQNNPNVEINENLKRSSLDNNNNNSNFMADNGNVYDSLQNELRASDANILNNNQFFRNSDIKSNNICDTNFGLAESSSISSFDNRDKEIIMGGVEKVTINSNPVADTNLTSTNLKERNLKEITNKFDIEKLKRSLTVDFIDFDRDSLGIRRKMQSREERLNKLEKIIKVWIEIAESLKKSVDHVTSSMQLFNENFIQEPLDIFEECPDLISLIYTLQSAITDITGQFKIFSVSVENSFVNQLKNFLNQSIQELRESKQACIKHTDEFNYISTKFLSTKKSGIKESMKDNYNSQYRLLEFTRYNLISKINQNLLFIKIELPEKISLLIYAFMSLFRQGNNILNRIEYNVNANLEKVSVKYKEKEKIKEEIKLNKKELVKSFGNVNTSIQAKEGFLYVKQKDTNEYFKKRYFKIHNGNLIFFKLKKGTDQVDISKHFALCNLLLSNVKRNDKEYDYPFCFEIISATNKKGFLFQGETEKEAEEWVCAIRNAIANSISHYQNESPGTNIKDNPIDTSFTLVNYGEGIDTKKDNMIDKLISTSKCTDCDSDSPTWCSINWLCLICIDCSGVHRSLGVQISKIRSLRLDNLEPELIELIDIMGLDKINQLLESSVKSYEKPRPNSMYQEKEVYITNKYKFKKFIKFPNLSIPNVSGQSSQDSINSGYIFKFIDSDNLINIYHFLKLDLCDINKLYDFEKERYSFLHHAAKKGKINSFKLLILLGAEIQLPDAKNFKPIDYATIYKYSEIADFIVRKLDELK